MKDRYGPENRVRYRPGAWSTGNIQSEKDLRPVRMQIEINDLSTGTDMLTFNTRTMQVSMN